VDAQVADNPDLEGETGKADPSAARPRPSPLANPSVRIGLAIIALLVALGLAWMAIQWWTIGRYIQTTNDAFLQADQETVSPRVGGYVEAVLVSDNQNVVAGQPLVMIDPRDPNAKLEQTLAQVAQGRASIAQTQAQIRQQQSQVDQAKAQLAGQLTTAAYDAQEVDRYAPLAASGAETAERLAQLKQTRDQARSQAQAGAASLQSAQRQLGILKAEIGVSQAQIDQAEAQARQARVDVDSTVVRAGLAGRIGDRSVRQGQYVQPGTRLMSVVPLQGIYLIANFKETQIGRMRPGQPVEVKVDALGGRKLHGVIDSFAPGTGAQFALIPPANATGNFTKIVQRVPVRIRVDVPAEVRPVILPGLSVTVAVDTKPAAGQ
jgi:membrane fusion protein (multidrug efflux system)